MGNVICTWEALHMGGAMYYYTKCKGGGGGARRYVRISAPYTYHVSCISVYVHICAVLDRFMAPPPPKVTRK